MVHKKMEGVAVKILSYGEYKAREAAINRQHDSNLALFAMHVHNENMMRRLRDQQNLRDRGRFTLMGRAKTALHNIISLRRENHGKEGHPERGRPVHRGISEGGTSGSGSQAQGAGINQHNVLGTSRRGSSRKSG